MKNLKAVAVGVSFFVVATLSACVTTPEKQNYADITFKHLSPINLDVGEIRIENKYHSPLKSSHIEHDLPVKIDSSVTRWAQDRLRAVGGSGSVAVITINDASAVEKALKKETGLTGLITRDQAELYDFNVNVDISIETISGGKGFANAAASRQKSVPEDITLNEREQMYFEQVEILMRDFDLEMEKNIRSFLAPFVR